MKDVITDIFSELRLHSQLYFTTEFRGDFGITIPNEKRLVRFHYVSEGSCIIDVPYSGEFHLTKGDLIIIPNGVTQSIKAYGQSQCVSLMSVIEKHGISEGCLSYGSGKNMVKLLCGYCQYDEELDHPILNNLETIVLTNPNKLDEKLETQAALSLLSIEVESNKAGMTGVLSRLLEILFIQSFRKVVQNKEVRFIQALQDIKIGRSLALMHEQYNQNWTVSKLASGVGMSRARFADKFVKLVGLPPIAYLTKWRLMKSRGMLKNTAVSLEIISERCGYSSLAAFSRRFKEEYNQAPSVYRKSNIL